MPSAYDPRLTVIIPTWNRARLLERCLSSLARQRVRCPVLVVDNGSTDSTREMLEIPVSGGGSAGAGGEPGVRPGGESGHPPLQFRFRGAPEQRHGGGPGLGGGGTGGVRPEPLLLVPGFPNDGLPAEEPDRQRRRRLRPDGDALQAGPGRIRASSTAAAGRCWGPARGRLSTAATCSDRIGLFDETYYMYLEDVELSLRAQLTGHPCLYVPEAVVYHIEAASDHLPGRLGGKPASAGRRRPPTIFGPVKTNTWTETGQSESSLTSAAGLLFAGPSLLDHPEPVATDGDPPTGAKHPPVGLRLGPQHGVPRSSRPAIWDRSCGDWRQGMARTPQALIKRFRVRRHRVLSGRDICRLMNGC